MRLQYINCYKPDSSEAHSAHLKTSYSIIGWPKTLIYYLNQILNDELTIKQLIESNIKMNVLNPLTESPAITKRLFMYNTV